jgi:hypothetical protein
MIPFTFVSESNILYYSEFLEYYKLINILKLSKLSKKSTVTTSTNAFCHTAHHPKKNADFPPKIAKK